MGNIGRYHVDYYLSLIKLYWKGIREGNRYTRGYESGHSRYSHRYWRLLRASDRVEYDDDQQTKQTITKDGSKTGTGGGHSRNCLDIQCQSFGVSIIKDIRLTP